MSSTLTFGLEIEFSIAILREGRPDYEPHVGRSTDFSVRQPFHPPYPNHPTQACKETEFGSEDFVRLSVVHFLQKAGLSAIAILNDGEAGELLYGDVGDEKIRIASYFITTDCTIDPPVHTRPGLYNWYGIEINSPAFWMSDAALLSIQSACQALTSNFRINTNESNAGLHVHVGNGIKGFPLPVLKDLLSFLYIFNPQLMSIHPPNRQTSTYAGPISNLDVSPDNFQNNGDIDEGSAWYDILANEKSSLEPVRAIQERATLSELVDLVSRGLTIDSNNPWPAYRFSQLEDDGSSSMKKTVEFRMHEATLNTDRVINYIRTVVGIVELIHATHDSYWLIEFMKKHSEAKVTLPQLLGFMGLTEPAAFYRSHPGFIYEDIRNGFAWTKISPEELAMIDVDDHEAIKRWLEINR